MVEAQRFQLGVVIGATVGWFMSKVTMMMFTISSRRCRRDSR